MPQMLRKTLLECGIAEQSVQVIPSEEEAVAKALEDCQSGDLLVILGDEITRCWKQIVSFNGGVEVKPSKAKPSAEHPEKLFASKEQKFQLEEGQSLVHDDRGVRLVVERDEESD